MIVHDRLAFTPEENVRRYENIQAAMAVTDLNALLIRGPENITYFSGYETLRYYKYHCVVMPKDPSPPSWFGTSNGSTPLNFPRAPTFPRCSIEIIRRV